MTDGDASPPFKVISWELPFSAMHLNRMEWPPEKVVASSLVMPEQRTESKVSSAFGISFLLQVRKSLAST